MTAITDLNIVAFSNTTTGLVFSSFLYAVFTILAGGTILHLVAKYLKIKETKWKTAFTVATIQAGMMFLINLTAGYTKFRGINLDFGLLLWSVEFAVWLVLVKRFYDLRWSKTLLAAFAVWLINIFASVILLILLFMIGGALMFYG